MIGAVLLWTASGASRYRSRGTLHPGQQVRVCDRVEDGLAMALHDVTKQRAVETKKKNRTLLSSEEHLRMAAEAALIGTWEADPQTGVRHWSSQFRAILGMSEDIQPSVGLFSSLIDPRDRARINDLYQRAHEGENGGRYAAEFRIRRADDGSKRWVSARGQVFFDKQRRAIRGIGALYDITDRKRAEEALKESEERFRLAAEAFQGGVADYDLGAHKVTRTKRQLEIIGEDESFPPTPEAWTERIHPEDRQTFIDARQQVITGDASHFEAEYRVRHRDGRWVWVWHRGMAMRDASGHLNRIISSLIEITARKQGETALRESEARFRHLADSAPALIWLTNRRGRLTFTNMHFEYVFGRRARSLVPRGWRDVVHPDDLTNSWRSS